MRFLVFGSINIDQVFTSTAPRVFNRAYKAQSFTGSSHSYIFRATRRKRSESICRAGSSIIRRASYYYSLYSYRTRWFLHPRYYARFRSRYDVCKDFGNRKDRTCYNLFTARFYPSTYNYQEEITTVCYSTLEKTWRSQAMTCNR
jgi:hypothetical protein